MRKLPHHIEPPVRQLPFLALNRMSLGRFIHVSLDEN